VKWSEICLSQQRTCMKQIAYPCWNLHTYHLQWTSECGSSWKILYFPCAVASDVANEIVGSTELLKLERPTFKVFQQRSDEEHQG
jgi:hypothetical protein